MRYKWVFLFVFTLLAGVSGAVLAQTRDQQRMWCKDESNPDVSIGACTAVIQFGPEINADIAEAFNNRGIAYRALGQLARASEDFAKARQLNPKLPPLPR